MLNIPFSTLSKKFPRNSKYYRTFGYIFDIFDFVDIKQALCQSQSFRLVILSVCNTQNNVRLRQMSTLHHEQVQIYHIFICLG